MAMYTNAQILSAVLTTWLQPVITEMGVGKLMGIPALAALQNKVRATGWVSPNWSMVSELSPIINKVGGRIVEPIISSYISQYPDRDLPVIAHGIVDAAIEQGRLDIMEGTLSFDMADLQSLKRLLDINLPAGSVQTYTVRTEMPTEDGGESPSD